MPKDQRQLRHLLSLLAQLQKGRFAGHRFHELRDPIQDALVFFCHANVCVRLDIVGRSARRNHVVARYGGAIVARDAIVVLLLGRRGCSSGCLSLGLRLRLCLKLTMLRYMMMWLLVVGLGPLALILLLVREDMLHLLLRLVVFRDLRGVRVWRKKLGRLRWTNK
jgi:hypothetical protein